MFKSILQKTNARNRHSIQLGYESLEPRVLMAGDFLLTWAAGLIVGDFGGSRGGIFVARSDGSDMRQLTVSQTNNFEFSGHGLNLPDDHPSISPNGREIVFTTSRYQEPGQSNNFEIAIMNVDGSNLRRLTSSPGVDTEPVISPDGTKIAFVSDRTGNLDIWSMNIDGTGLQQLTNSPDGEVEPAWSHVGDRLAFARVLFGGVFGVFGARKDVYIMNANGSNKELIAGQTAEEHDAVWSVDDQRLVFTSEKDNTLPFGDVVVIDIATKQYVSNLTIDDRFLFIGGGGDPSLSPDGSKIAYFKATGGLLLLAGPQKVHVMNANGTGKVKIDAPGIINVHPHLGKLADTDLDGTPDYIDINSPSDFNLAMIQDEARVVANLGGLTVLSGTGGVALLAARGYLPAHNFDSFQGMGVAFVRDLNDSQPSILGKPDVLLYQPDLNGLFGPRNPVDLLPDFNYTLIGWGYASNYNPQQLPGFAGFPEDAWLVHEAGFHPISSGEFEPTTPTGDNPRGIKAGNVRPSTQPLTPWHQRLWDIHFFRRPGGGTPVAAIHDPFGRNLPGNPTGTNAFFFPQLPYRGRVGILPLIEAEDFDMGQGFGWSDITTVNSGNAYRVTGVDIAKSVDRDASHDIISIKAGEFLQYTVDVPVSRNYELTMRMINQIAGGQFHIEVDGVNRSGAKSIPVTAGVSSSDYASVPIFETFLLAGKHTIRFVFDSLGTSGGPIPLSPLRFNSFTLAPPSIPTLATKANITIKESKPFTQIDVTYTDSAAINVSTIATGNILVTGPNGFQQIATHISTTESSNSPSVIAAYRIAAPGTGWDPADNGIYSIDLSVNSVKDATGVAIAAGQIATLNVSVQWFEIIDDLLRQSKYVVVNGSEGRDQFSLSNQRGAISIDRNSMTLGTVSVAELREIRVNGVGGDDSLTTGAVAVPMIVEGGDGNDLLSSGDGDDTLNGGSGDDVLMGGLGDDNLNGGDGNDTLNGGTGNNTLDEGPGRGGIEILGTPGRDEILVDREETADGAVVVVQLNGQKTSSAYRNGETIIVRGEAGHDFVRLIGKARDTWSANFFGGAGSDVLIGGFLADELHGDAGVDRLYGLGGADVLLGGAGRDTLFGNYGDDYLEGGDDNDHLFGGNGNDSLHGQQGVDRLFGQVGNDLLFGGNDNDFLYGGSDRDALIGGNGRDLLFGGADDDLLIGDSALLESDIVWRTQLVQLGTATEELTNRLARLRVIVSRQTISHDHAVDKLFGGQGRDWFVDLFDFDHINGFAQSTIWGDVKN